MVKKIQVLYLIGKDQNKNQVTVFKEIGRGEVDSFEMN